ncbi:hypothetical protein ACFX15_020136 [Malus domestica]
MSWAVFWVTTLSPRSTTADTSVGLLPYASDCPEVPARAAAAAAVARVIAGPEVLCRVHGGQVGLYDGQFMDGYPSDEDREAIFQAYIKA